MGTIRNILGFGGIILIGFALYGTQQPQVLPSLSFSMTGAIVIVALTGMMALIGILALRMSQFDTQTLLTYPNKPEKSHAAVGPTTRTLSDQSALDREELRRTVEKILEEQGVSQIDQRIDEGAWTSDRVAAAFVSETCSYPILDRLRSWFEQDGTNKRRLDRAINAMHRRYQEVS